MLVVSSLTMDLRQCRAFSWPLFGVALATCAGAVACGSSGNAPGETAEDGGSGGSVPESGSTGAADAELGGTHADGSSGAADAELGGADADGTALARDAGLPSGWLYTSGSKIYVSSGSGGTQWMGRGVNMDDIFLCGYNNTLYLTSPDQTLETIVSGLITGWKPNFVRVSLGMDSYPTVASWLSDDAQYKTPMTTIINAVGANPGVYVLVTLRSDASMIGQDTVDGDPEATGIPSDSTTTPNATLYPTGTDAVYVALVDTFANARFVLFGLTNEPGGDKQSSATLSAAMSHAVGVIRAEEDRLGVPHHLVSVQGNGWTSDISFFSESPLSYDNVVYEVHGYPPSPSSYTYSNIPVILGEYGSLTDSASFYADVEAKQIPNLAWDFEPYSNCAPDLLNVTNSATTLTASAWGTVVQSYLMAP
jgi:hypothetical protein